MRGKSKMQENMVLIYGSGALAFFYNFLDYLHITEAQVLSLSAIFLISSLVMMFKCLTLRLSMIQFFIMELVSKFCLIFVPFVIAIGAKQIPALNYLVDYVFSLLIIGEIFSIMISIQSIRTRKFIDDVDFFNFFIIKFKAFIYKHFELRKFNEYGKNYFEEWIEEQEMQENKNKELKNQAKLFKSELEKRQMQNKERIKKEFSNITAQNLENEHKRDMQFEEKFKNYQEQMQSQIQEQKKPLQEKQEKQELNPPFCNL